MNYIKEINAFNDWLLSNPLPTGAIALWYQIMAINNKAGWADRFTIANLTLQSLTGLSRQGLDRSRNVLVQKGLIDYEKGTSNKAGKYHIYSFECKIIGTAVGTVVGTKRAQEGSQSGHSSSTLNKLNETKYIDNNNTARDAEIITCIEKEFGRPLSPMEIDQVSLWEKMYPNEVIVEALKIMILQGVYKLVYMDRILEGWEKNNLKTIQQIREHEEKWKERKGAASSGNRHKLGGKVDDELEKIDWSRFGC